MKAIDNTCQYCTDEYKTFSSYNHNIMEVNGFPQSHVTQLTRMVTSLCFTSLYVWCVSTVTASDNLHMTDEYILFAGSFEICPIHLRADRWMTIWIRCKLFYTYSAIIKKLGRAEIDHERIGRYSKSYGVRLSKPLHSFPSLIWRTTSSFATDFQYFAFCTTTKPSEAALHSIAPSQVPAQMDSWRVSSSRAISVLRAQVAPSSSQDEVLQSLLLHPNGGLVEYCRCISCSIHSTSHCSRNRSARTYQSYTVSRTQSHRSMAGFGRTY